MANCQVQPPRLQRSQWLRQRSSPDLQPSRTARSFSSLLDGAPLHRPLTCGRSSICFLTVCAAAQVQRLKPGRVCRLARAEEADNFAPPSRWTGAGMGQAASPNLQSLIAAENVEGQAAAVVLEPNMTVGGAIAALLAANVVCVSKDSEQVFYVQLAGNFDDGSDSTEVCCVTLADLLNAPRQMPVSCILSDSQAEECDLYLNTPEPYADRTVATELASRLPWLVSLLACLTVSAGILEYFDGILQRHLVIAFYLTALVGCGGNAGSQACALVLQALATGEVVPSSKDALNVLTKELLVSLGIAFVLAAGVGLRIGAFGGSFGDVATIALSMVITVTFSVVFGASLPLGLQKLGADPAKISGPLLSTVVDILGVLVACLTAYALESAGVYS
eukprot:TRINITY_DN92395_c0_g1_i1.p1 TRINITY_DN92395_c0_g1~~TRINITY_DN92395_c0_g1_i1.p1  ORF type:complete len:391 (+),score=62.64 TRINITY_DN92395_c0_g1_i1:131-1303(+)